MQGDYLVRGTSRDGAIRFFACRTTALVEELRKRHRLSPTASAALGRTTTIAAMMGTMLKGDDQLTVQLSGGGPLGKVVADADANGVARGYVDDPDADLPLNAIGKLDVSGAVGTDGFLHVVKDLGLKEPYRGTVPIVSGEIAEDFAYYFTVSEQTPSGVGAGVLVDRDRTIRAAGGFIVQLLPAVSTGDVDEVEKRLGALPQVTALIDAGETPEAMIARIVPWELNLLDRIPVRFGCRCSQEKTERTLISLGSAEIRDMIREQNGAEVVCHFCGEIYRFNSDELAALADEADAARDQRRSSGSQADQD